MAKEKSVLIADIDSYVAKFGGRYAEWYVGTSTDAKYALYTKHKLKQGDPGLVRTAITELQAAEVVTHFVTRRKTKGEADSVVEQNRLHVYAYKLQPHTKP